MLLQYVDSNLQITQSEDLVDQVETEHKVLNHKIQEEGFELGVRSTSRLSSKDFEHFERVQSLGASLSEDALEYLWTFLDTRGYPQDARIHDPDFAHLLEINPDSRILFVQSWMDGVLSVWQTIKTQFDRDW